MQHQVLMRQINTSLTNEGIIKAPLPFNAWAGPNFFGKDAYAFSIDTARLEGRIDRLYSKQALHRLSTDFKGRKVRYVNSRGFAYVIINELVDRIQPKPVMDWLLQARAMLIAGTDRSGKTTLAQHVMKAIMDRDPAAQFIVHDPKIKMVEKEGPDKWLSLSFPGRVRIVGRGGDFEAMTESLVSIYERMLKGGYGHPMWVLVDEYYVTKQHIDVATFAKEIASLGGEPEVNIIIINHSKQVAGLDFDGEGDMRDMFSQVWLPVMGKCEVLPKGYSEWFPALHPGPFKVEFSFSHDEKILAKIIVLKQDGRAGIEETLKSVDQHLPERYRQRLTRWKLQEIFSDWEAKGYLTKSSSNAPRMAGGVLKGTV